MWPVAMVMVVINIVTVEPRVERSEHILMGTAGTMLDWVLKKKVSLHLYYIITLQCHVHESSVVWVRWWNPRR